LQAAKEPLQRKRLPPHAHNHTPAHPAHASPPYSSDTPHHDMSSTRSLLQLLDCKALGPLASRVYALATWQRLRGRGVPMHVHAPQCTHAHKHRNAPTHRNIHVEQEVERQVQQRALAAVPGRCMARGMASAALIGAAGWGEALMRLYAIRHLHTKTAT